MATLACSISLKETAWPAITLSAVLEDFAADASGSATFAAAALDDENRAVAVRRASDRRRRSMVVG